MSDQFTHLDASGNPSMVNVGKKEASHRVATARAVVVLPNDVISQLQDANELFDIYFNTQNEVVIDCTASVTAKTGVEMEAMTGASIAALTIYDMCKAFSHDIIIQEIKLMAKSGGKRNFKR